MQSRSFLVDRLVVRCLATFSDALLFFLYRLLRRNRWIYLKSKLPQKLVGGG